MGKIFLYFFIVSARAEGFSLSKAAPTFFFPVAVLLDAESEELRPPFLVDRRGLEAPPRRSNNNDGRCDERVAELVRSNECHLRPVDDWDLAVHPVSSKVSTNVRATNMVVEGDIL